MQWSTFSVLIMFFAACGDEMRQIMFAMGIITEDVKKLFNIGIKE